MPNLFQQLEKAEKERELLERQAKLSESGPKKAPPNIQTARKGALQSPSLEVEEEMITLYRNIRALLPGEDRKILQFCSANPHEGTSVIARELAKVITAKLGHKVLLLDMDPNAEQFTYFGLDPKVRWSDALLGDKDFNEAQYQIENSLLHLSHIALHRDEVTQILHSSWTANLFEEVRKDFDITLIDAPAMSESSDSLAIAERVDGVVLVVECEKTRWQTLQEIQNNIEMRGGRIAGVVLNRKRQHVPGFILDRF